MSCLVYTSMCCITLLEVNAALLAKGSDHNIFFTSRGFS